MSPKLNAKLDFYKELDPRDTPLYGIAEAARAIDGMPRSTLRDWCTGTRKIIEAASSERPVTLSFNNVIEARVLRILRIDHEVRLKAIRDSIAWAEQKLALERLLLRRDLRTDGAKLLIEKYGNLIELNRSAQLAMKHVLDNILDRVEWDTDNFAHRLYPTFKGGDNQKVVYLGPLVSFGAPIVSNRGISTRVLFTRYNSGESIMELQVDYELTQKEVEYAIVFEEAA